MSGSHGRFEYRLLPAITATAAQWQMDAFGRHWQLPMTFTDAWAELHPGNPDPSTINNDPVRLDARGSNFAQPFCIFFTKSQRTTRIHSLNQHMFARFCSLHVFFIFLPSYLALFNQSDFKLCLVCHMLSPALCSLTRTMSYFQKTPLSVGQSIVQSQIWPRAAGSDHRAVSGDVVLNR